MCFPSFFKTTISFLFSGRIFIRAPLCKTADFLQSLLHLLFVTLRMQMMSTLRPKQWIPAVSDFVEFIICVLLMVVKWPHTCHPAPAELYFRDTYPFFCSFFCLCCGFSLVPSHVSTVPPWCPLTLTGWFLDPWLNSSSLGLWSSLMLPFVCLFNSSDHHAINTLVGYFLQRIT